jgi:hypothetical protein
MRLLLNRELSNETSPCLNQALVAFLVLWGTFIWATYGLYREVLVGFLPALCLLPLIKWPKFFKNVSDNQILLSACLFSLALSATSPALMYSTNAYQLWILRGVACAEMLCVILAFVLRGRISQVFFALTFILALAALGLVVPFSPTPYIDVWSYSQLAVDAWVQGLNPYDIQYPAMYEGVHGHFPYLPFVLECLVPFKMIFGDVRYAMISAIALSALFLFLIARRQFKLPAALGLTLLFLTFPALQFVIEQSWTDPLSILFLFLFAWLWDKKLKAGAVLALSCFVSVKQYNVFFGVPFLIFIASRYRSGVKNLWLRGFRDLALFLTIPILSLLPFLIWNTPALLERVLHVPVMDQPFFMSLENWFARRDMPFSDVFSIVTAGVAVLLIIFKTLRRKPSLSQLAFGLSGAFLWLLNFYSHTAANYLWFSTLGIWLAISSGDVMTGKIPFDWGIFSISRILIIFAAPIAMTDVGVYYEWAQKILLQGQLPYVNFVFEYPPGSLPFILLPYKFDFLSLSHAPIAYRFFFQVLLLLVEILFFRRLRRHYGENTRAIFLYLFFTCLLLPLLYDRLDLILALSLVYPLVCGARDSWRSALAISFGAALKLVPILLVPQFVFPEVGKSRRKSLALALVAGAPLVLIVSALTIISPDHTVSFLSYHAQRGIQIESLYGGAILALQSLGAEIGVTTVRNFGAYHLSETPALKQIAQAIWVVSLLSAFVYVFFSHRRGEREWPLWSWLIVGSFVAFGRVLSPQFLIWLAALAVPLIERLAADRRKLFTVAFSFTLVLTTALFYNYLAFVQGDPFWLAVLNIRNLTLIALLPLAIRWTQRSTQASHLAKSA